MGEDGQLSPGTNQGVAVSHRAQERLTRYVYYLRVQHCAQRPPETGAAVTTELLVLEVFRRVK